MTRLFCPVCGRKAKKLYDGLCEECYRRLHPLINRIEKPIEVRICSSCLSYRIGGRWVVPSSDDPLREAVLEAIKHSIDERNISDIKLREDLESPFFDKVFQVKITVTGSTHKGMKEYKEEYVIPLKLIRELCPACKDIKARRELGRVQVRALNRELTSNEMKLVSEVIKKELEVLYSKDRSAVPIEVKVSSKGVDYAFSSQHVARSLALRLQRTFSADLLETHKEIGVLGGKKLTRITYRLLLPSFKEHDVVEFNGRPYYVVSKSGGSIRLMSLGDYSIKNVKPSRGIMSRFKVICKAEEALLGMIVSVTPPYVQVMELKNYNVLELYMRKVPLWIKEGDKVRIVRYGEEFFITPYEYTEVK